MKKIISILICIQIALFPALAFASANVGGWTLGNPIAQGASAVVNGTKTAIINGASVIKNSTAKITPPASSVAKVLAKGAAGYALSVAVEQLLGAVDWVLDPANNQIKYSDPDSATLCIDNCPAFPQFYYFTSGSLSSNRYVSTSASCAAWIESEKNSSGQPEQYSSATYSSGRCSATRTIGTTKYPISSPPLAYVNNPAYDPTAEQEQKTLPLDVVAQKVISNAQNGDTQAQVATVAAAQDIINEAETDQTKARPIVNQLEANAETATDETATGEATPKADPVTGEQAPPTDISLEFPKFCTWAPTICEAAQVVISFPNTLTEWWETANSKADEWASSISQAWTEAKEWITGEPDLQEDQTDLPIEEQTLDRDPSSFDTDYIVLGSQCPSFEPYTVEVGPISKTLSMDLSPLCDFAAQVRPAILGMSYLTAAGIVVAAIRET